MPLFYASASFRAFLIILAAVARLDGRRRFVPLAGGVPSHDTLSRVFALLDRRHFKRYSAACAPEAFEWADGSTVAIAGK